MSMLLMARAFGIHVGNASRKLVLLKLADNANDKGECWPSYQHIADQCEISKRTAMNHIDALSESGLIRKTSRKGPKGNSTNLYIVTLWGEESAPPPSEAPSPGSAADSPGSVNAAPPPSANAAPGISHSFESVSEPPSEPVASGAEPQALTLDGGSANDADDELAKIPADLPGPKDPKAKTFRPWANYAVAYRQRYGVYPIWNQRVAGQLSQLVDRVGKDLAPAVAVYYLRINSQFYVAKGHGVGLLLQDCEAIATQMQTGSQMTTTRARQMDGSQANLSAVDEAKAMLRASWGDE
ncbi:helix-turn-helix domain-containing protein [Halomonas sp. IOP_31]|uniref:helix-turn-helix domain-containing protein n=1 Tax=Halomonas sp. IOP_31 TaxID=2876584 RepID=UPI001E3C07B4|nr:helix-turn-helix domain-containing protein [Halomonas sp. IOP_31]MCD6006877.1 helix-turn-helix domain-containing protein [Halomonas sp. IOP_31]